MNRIAHKQQLLRAYEIVGNDLDDRNMQKLADRVTDVMSRIAQSTWQNIGDSIQNAGEAVVGGAEAVGQGIYNGAAAAGQFAYSWLTPQGLAQQSVQFLQQQFNSAVDQKVKQQIAQELQRRGIPPGQSTAKQAPAGGAQAPASGTTNQSAAGMSNSEQVLANQYLKWGQAQPKKTGLLNTIYQHASQNQSPQYVNKLMTFLKANGITQ